MGLTISGKTLHFEKKAPHFWESVFPGSEICYTKEAMKRIHPPGDPFFQILLSSCLLVIVVLILTLTLTAGRYEQEAIEKSYREQLDILEKTTHDLDRMHEALRALVIQLYFDESISGIRNLKELDPVDVRRAFSKISYAAAVLPYVESVYVVSHYAGIVYHVIPFGPAQVFRAEEFPDPKALELFDRGRKTVKINHRTVPLWHDGRRMDEYNGFTFSFSTDGSREADSEGGIIINISDGEIKNLLSAYFSMASSESHLFSRKGTDLLNGGSVSSPPVFKHYENRGYREESGYFISGRGSLKTLYVHRAYQPFDWLVINAIPYEEIVRDIGRARLLTILSGIITLGLSLVLAYVLTKTAYKPIEKKLSRAKQMEKDAAQARESRREAFLLSLLKGTVGEPDEQTLREYCPSLDRETPFLIILFLFDSPREGSPPVNHDILTGLFRSPWESIRTDENRLILLLQQETLDDGEIAAVREEIRRHRGLTFSLVISEPVRFSPELPGLYRLVLQAGFSRFFHGRESLIRLDNWKKRLNEEPQYPAVLERKLCQGLTTDEAEGAEELFRQFLAVYENSTVLRLKHGLERFCSALFGHIALLEKKGGEIFPITFEEAVAMIEEAPYLADLTRGFLTLFKELEEYRRKAGEGRKSKIITDAEEIVLREYPNPLFGMEDAARTLGISAGYLGKIYKTERGYSLVEHINRVRIEKAKELLALNQLSVKEIGRTVGYANPQHFHRVFKKSTGLSPSLYRLGASS